MSRREWEKELVHPAALQWFTERGYACDHETPIADGSIPDIVARRGFEVIVGECKAIRANMADVLTQIDRYRRVLNPTNIYLFVPKPEISNELVQLCRNSRIDVVGLNVQSRRMGRIPAYESTIRDLKEFAYGFDGTYDEAIRELLRLAKTVNGGGRLLDAGKRLKEKAQ